MKFGAPSYVLGKNIRKKSSLYVSRFHFWGACGLSTPGGEVAYQWRMCVRGMRSPAWWFMGSLITTAWPVAMR